MSKVSLKHLLLIAFNLGIVTTLTTPALVKANSILIDQNGHISIQSSILGVSTKGNTNRTKSERVYTSAKDLKVVVSPDNQIRLQTKSSDGKTTTVAEEDEVILTQKVATGEAKTRITAADRNKYIITNGIAAKVNTPISINLATGEMTITNASGTKVVTTLPDAALQKARAGTNLIVDLDDDEATDSAKVATDSAKTATDSTEVATKAATTNEDEDSITLINYQNTTAYEVKGHVKKNLLGIVPISLKKKVYVSAVSGNIIATEQTGFSKFLESISF